jgi:hypothetical protein
LIGKPGATRMAYIVTIYLNSRKPIYAILWLCTGLHG